MVALESKLFALQFNCLIETEINQSQIEYFNRIRRLTSVVKYIIVHISYMHISYIIFSSVQVRIYSKMERDISRC